MNRAVLELAGVGKRYADYASVFQRFANWFGAGFAARGEFWAIRDVSFSVQAGESIALIGGNGAGKSTLLKMITGTVRPTIGAIGVNGRISAILELGLGFNPEFTGRRNVLNAGGLMGFSQEDLRKMLPLIEEFSELGEFFDAPLRIYSSGMQARLAFALATARRPEILIVDEALSVGDSHFQAKCFERISSFREMGTSLILVSHAMQEVVKHCNRALYIEHGRVLFDGDSRTATNIYLSALNRTTSDSNGEHAVVALDMNDDVFASRPSYRKEEHRWGDGGASILDYVVTANGVPHPPEIDAGNTVEFKFSVKFLIDCDTPVPGILIKSLDGFFVYGTNSTIASNRPAARAGADEVRLYSFKIPMRLASGGYLISFGISARSVGELKPLDRRYDSVMLHINNQTGFWGLCDLNAQFETIDGKTDYT